MDKTKHNAIIDRASELLKEVLSWLGDGEDESELKHEERTDTAENKTAPEHSE